MAFIRHPKDFFAGLIFIAFGLAAIIIGSNYSLGSAARMGPGYFPRILGILLLEHGQPRVSAEGSFDQRNSFCRARGRGLHIRPKSAAAALALVELRRDHGY